jgi:hypothetical protein
MHSIEIFRDGQKYVTIYPDSNSSQTKAVMGDNKITLGFELSFEAKFKIGDYCTVFDEVYRIYDNPPPVTKNTRFKYVYTLTMESLASELKKVRYLFYNDDNSFQNPDFSLTGMAEDKFINLWFKNLDRYVNGPNSVLLYPNTFLEGWSSGEIIPTDTKTITFSQDNLLSALSKVAEKFNTEWWVIGKTIHLTKKVKDTGITLKHGRQKGLYDITRQAADGSQIITCVTPWGSNRNLPADYGSDRLRLTALDPQNFVSRNTELYGVIEKDVIFEDIYPTRTGTITSVNSTNVYEFIDTSISFNLNSNLLPGLTAKVAFLDGDLAGWQFEIAAYNNSTKKVTILKNKDETSIDVPSASLKPRIGDKYKFVDIKLPGEYVTAAETRLLQEASAWLIENAEPKYTVSINLDPTFVRNKRYVFSIGDLIWITDNDLDLDRKIRIVGTTRNIVEEDKYSLTLSDVVPRGYTQKTESKIVSTQENVNQVASTLQNGALYNGRMVIPTTTDVSNMLPLYIDKTTDKIYKKI